jgi:hypothetical protein
MLVTLILVEDVIGSKSIFIFVVGWEREIKGQCMTPVEQVLGEEKGEQGPQHKHILPPVW